MRNATRAVFVLGFMAVTVVLGGCASSQGGGDSAFDRDEPTLIQVTNRNLNRVVIEALSSGRSRRLGEVETNATQTFRLPATMSTLDLQIGIDPIGPSGSFVISRIMAGPGDLVIVTVEPNIGMSRATVR